MSNFEIWTDDYGNEWLRCCWLNTSPYAGNTLFATANIEYLESRRDISIMETGGLSESAFGKGVKFSCPIGSGRGAAVRGENFGEYDVVIASLSFDVKRAYINLQNASLCEAVYALESYPVFDDEKLSEVEDRWENEMWRDWLMEGLIANASRFFPNLERFFNRQDLSTGSDMEELLWNAYRQACDDTATRPEPEGNGLWIDVERLCKPFGALVLDALRVYHKKRWYIKTLAMRNRMVFLPGMEDLAFTMHGNIPR